MKQNKLTDSAGSSRIDAIVCMLAAGWPSLCSSFRFPSRILDGYNVLNSDE